MGQPTGQGMAQGAILGGTCPGRGSQGPGGGFLGYLPSREGREGMAGLGRAAHPMAGTGAHDDTPPRGPVTLGASHTHRGGGGRTWLMRKVGHLRRISKKGWSRKTPHIHGTSVARYATSWTGYVQTISRLWLGWFGSECPGACAPARLHLKGGVS